MCGSSQLCQTQPMAAARTAAGQEQQLAAIWCRVCNLARVIWDVSTCVIFCCYRRV